MQSAFAAAALFFLAGLPLALGTGCYPNDCKSCPLDRDFGAPQLYGWYAAGGPNLEYCSCVQDKPAGCA
ncbi:unnamed protein product [Zymoseptoria tritici ST99CH_1A5]|uniref:Uncharacterized protein n=3 Tax=Zymoseptoria tritici TaxID=1047171 RepID=A0A1X7S231_ZYMT9|nr:unnamed protein product [Zymoseptoria tritici ST99CH_3D7]SMR56818.1 unnamed protein product [Zymoseptoria tritici ST99CH_1E4]SMY26867.1 unnamed protein product [Zymoseptoria tritici ST99CH_1A5]